jgi:hypothetical protein
MGWFPEWEEVTGKGLDEDFVGVEQARSSILGITGL